MSSQKNKGEDQGHGSRFKQRQHEQNRPAGIQCQIFAKDHDGAAKAHDLPGDKKADRVLQAEDAKGAYETHGCTENPAPLMGSRCAKPARGNRGSKAKTHQPKRIR